MINTKRYTFRCQLPSYVNSTNMNQLSVSVVLSICFLQKLQAQMMLDLEQLQRITSYSRCLFDSDCKENAFCFGNDHTTAGNCKCKDNFYLDRSSNKSSEYECFKPSSSNEPCTKDIHCQITMSLSAICRNQRTCSCNESSHLDPNGMCYSSSKLTESCQVDNNCRLRDGSYGFCTDGHCKCRQQHHPTQDLLNCIPSIALGAPCEYHDSCNHTHAECYGVCRCSFGHATSSNGLKCLKVATHFEEPCEEDVQCAESLTGSICYESRCTCPVGLHGHGTACYRDAFPNERCGDRRECVLTPEFDDSVDCVDGVCRCLGVEIDDYYGCTVLDSSGVRNGVFVGVFVVFVLVVVNLR